MIYRADITDWPHLPTLWHEVFGDQWPFTPDLMQRAIIVPGGTQPREVLLAERDGRLVGFAVLEHDPSAPMGSRTGCLVALGVVPQARRRGIGSELHRVALDQFLAYGVRTLQLGGGSPRLWPGVPHALPEARAFFAAQGWIADDTTVDMIQHLGAYETPPALRERSLVLEIHVDVVATEQLDELLAFIAREFPSWLEDYRRIAALALYGHWSSPSRLDIPWQALLGADLGGAGVVGIAALQRQGIGTALMVRANEILRERGVGNSLVCWTWATDFYARVGYQVWQTYDECWRELTEAGRPAASAS
jgi:GNAT superfamily N-acetyltransferase